MSRSEPKIAEAIAKTIPEGIDSGIRDSPMSVDLAANPSGKAPTAFTGA
jgi:hypothetical protein